MRNTFLLILLLIQFSCAKPPKDSLTLKIQYQPEKTYHHTSERTTNSIIKYRGTEKSLQRLKSMGRQNPTFSNKRSHTQWVLKTGEMVDKIDFPLTLEYENTLTNDGKKGEPLKAIFHGKFLSDYTPIFDSVDSDGLDENDKATLLQSMENTFTQLSFPEKKLKIGEQFSNENLTSIPMEGSTVEVKVNTTYHLISISEGIAHFDISQQYILNPKLMDNSLKGSVSGKGYLVYDIDNTLVLNYTLDTEMEITKKLDSFEFELKTRSGIVQTTRILKD